MAANHTLAVATHILLMLASAPEEARNERGLISSEAVAGSVNTNPVVIRRVVADLARAGLVRSHPGKGGGLELIRPPERIRLYDVHAALDGPDLFAYKANRPNALCPVGSQVVGLLTPVFSGVQRGVERELKKTTIAQLVRRMT